MSNNTEAVNASPFNQHDERQRRHEALSHAVGLGLNRFSTEEVVEAAEQFRKFLAGESAKVEDVTLAPTEPGFYKYSGGRQSLLFLLDTHGQWYVITDSGAMKECVWEYIEQALGVWELEKIT